MSSGHIHITCTNGKTPIVWITRGTKNTQLSNGTEIVVQDIQPGELCLFTVMQLIESKGAKQVCPVSSMTVKFERAVDASSSPITKTIKCKCCTFNFELNGVTVNEDRCISEQLKTSAAGANTFWNQWLSDSDFKFNSHIGKMICNPTMMEPDHTFHGKYNSVSALTGWPQTGRVTFDPIHYARAVTYACIVLGAEVEHLASYGEKLPDNIADVLISTTLTAFAGNYPKIPEVVDDRCLGVLKLGLNRDCDDMAISVVGVFNFLKDVDMKQFCGELTALSDMDSNVCSLACTLLSNMRRRFTHAAAVICQAKPHVAVPNDPHDHDGDLIGHVFAILSPYSNLTHCLLVESTRMSSPSNLAIPAYHIGGRQAFTRKTVYEIGQGGIQSVKPFNARQYPECIAAYTPDSTYVLHSQDNVIGVHIEDLIAGTASAHKITGVPETACYPPICRTMAHRPDYAMVDAACAKYGWTSELADGQLVQPLTSPRIGDWMATGNYPVHRLGVSGWTNYAFVTTSGMSARLD